MTEEELFLFALRELQRLSNSNVREEVISSSKILRQLLLDGGNLVDLINKKTKLKIEFRLAVPAIPPEPFSSEGVWAVIDALYETDDPSRISALRRDQFFSTVIAGVDGENISIKDVVSFAANKMGGVHYEKELKGKDASIAQLSSNLITKEEAAIHLILRAVSRIVIAALTPLRNVVLGVERFYGAPGFSCILTLCIYPGEKDEDSYIIDVGASKEANRVSVYVDGRGELTVRVIDKTGNSEYLRSGMADRALVYGQHVAMVLEIGSVGDAVLISVEAGRWSEVRVLGKSQFDPQIDPKKNLVIGSDCYGKKKSHMLLMSWLVGSAVFRPRDKSRAIRYFEDQVSLPYKGVYFKESAHMHSEGHENFPQGN